MRNLQLLYSSHHNIPVKDAKYLVLDSNDSEKVYICTNEKLVRYNTFTRESEDVVADIFGAVSCEHLALNDEICVASEFGEVNVVNLHSKSIQEATFCEGGIEKMSWSPDQEVVVFITKSRSVVVMTSTYDPISEAFLTDESFGECEFITVGWGKKETQFHGSEGKQAAKIKSDFVIPENVKDLPQEINVSWRGDGELFVVSFVGSIGRMFKVFDREGKLKFTSEKVNGLSPQIAWKPTGSWIAVPQKLPNKCTIALFEKNGLRHREINLPFSFDTEAIVNLSWSNDSDILTIETEKDGKSFVYLYTIGNYHWYLKQFLQFESKVLNLCWDTGMNELKTLHVLLEDGSYTVYRWTQAIAHSFGDSAHNQSLVAVIDGKSLLVTDFRNNVIPPPMYNQKIATNDFINSCGFLRNPLTADEFNRFFIVNCKNEILFYDLELESTSVGQRLKGIKLLKASQLPVHFDHPLGGNHYLWLNREQMVVVCAGENSSAIHLINVQDKTLTVFDESSIDGQIGCVTGASDTWTFFVHTIGGAVHSLSTEDNLIRIEKNLHDLSEFCEKCESFNLNGKQNLALLRYNRSLYVNSTQIATDVTSFFLTRNYLAFTQLSSLKFLHLKHNQIVDERRIERGGKLVAIVPADSRTVLQMPRGNLEMISPRVLSLEIIGGYLDKLLYGKAMDVLRKQRINLNILCDHNLEVFLSNMDTFLDEVSNPQWLNLFLTDLQNQDFTKTMYSSNYDGNKSRVYPEDFHIENKVNLICKRLSKQMEEKDYNRFILPIITSHVKIGNIEKALDIIWEEKKRETKDLNKQKPRSEEALKYLLYLVDVNELYNVALGMYDFGLVLFVATKSQKDPKEYIPFLNELKKLEENYRKFKIDEYLKKNEKALEHISRCGEDEHFAEALEFIQKHKLFRVALDHYKGRKHHYQQIALAFADYLRAEGKLENASTMYERGGDLAQAILSARHVLDWRRCIALNKAIHGDNKVEMAKIVSSMVPALQESGRHDEAFHLLNGYSSEFEQALNCLLKGKLYLKAIFEAKMTRNELIESRIIPDLLQYRDVLKSALESDRETFLKYKNRLAIVRQNKAERNIDEHYENDVDECDLLSDTTSVNSSRYTGSSGRTGKTFRSSKNRRKHERKLLSLKEGNPFEDIALVDALHNHIAKITSQQQHIRDICKALIEISSDGHAREIQVAYKALLALVRDSLDEIWIAEMMSPQQLMTGPTIDYAQVQNEQRYALIDPVKRFKPQLNITTDWEQEILR